MRLSIAIVLAWLAAGSAAQAQGAVQAYGYVVDIPAGPVWRVTVGGRAEPIAEGSVLHPGATISVASASSGATLVPTTIAVMEYATGSVVKLQAGQVVPQARPPRQSSWARLGEAIGRRLSNERLSDGVIRTRILLKDAVHVTPGSLPWASLVADLPAGEYRVRLRRLDRDATPVGEWTGQSTIAVSAAGITPATYSGELANGLWQVSIRHQQTPSIGGDAWLLLTPDREAARQYAELSATLAAAADKDDAQVAQGAIKVRRAALLSLAPGA